MSKVKAGDKITINDVQLADIIRPTYGMDEGYSDMTVTKITDEFVSVSRPYISTSDFSYTGGVLRYIGLEEFNIYRPKENNRTEFTLMRRDKRFNNDTDSA